MAGELKRYLPFRDLEAWRTRDLPHDLVAAVAVAVLSVPQGVAYALIAGLPPAAGLYAAALPAVIGGLLRSSRWVVAGPSNALSLLVGGGVAALAASTGQDVVQVAMDRALERALDLAGEDHCHDAPCPLAEYLALRHRRQAGVR